MCSIKQSYLHGTSDPKLGLILVNLRCRNPITKIVLRATNSSVCFYTANKKVRAKHYNGLQLQLQVLCSSHAFFLLIPFFGIVNVHLNSFQHKQCIKKWLAFMLNGYVSAWWKRMLAWISLHVTPTSSWIYT